MNRNKKQLLTAGVLLVAVLGCYFGVKQYSAGVDRKQAEEEAAKMKQVTDFEVADVNAVFYTTGDAGAVLMLEEGTWICTTDQTLEIDTAKVEAFLENFHSIESENEITDYESMEEFGLEDSETSIAFTFADGSILTGTVGDYNDVLGVYYFRIDAEEAVYTVDGSIVNLLSNTADSFAVEEVEEEETEEETDTEDTLEE